MTGHLFVGTLLFQLFSPEYFGGGFVWMRLKWWRVTQLLLQKWLYGYTLSIDGVSQGLLYSANLKTYMDFYDFLNQVLSMFLDGGLKLYEIHMRYKFCILIMFPLIRYFKVIWDLNCTVKRTCLLYNLALVSFASSISI